jgi:hypothetical protein
VARAHVLVRTLKCDLRLLDRDAVRSFLSSFDTGAPHACRRRGAPAANRRDEVFADPDAVRSFLSSFDTGEACECRRRGAPAANRRDEVFAVLPSPGGRRRASSNVRSARVLRSARRAPRRFVPSRCVHWRYVPLRCDVRASPRGHRDRRRIESHWRLFWAHARVVSLQKEAAPPPQGDHGAFDEEEESKRPRTSL